MFYTFFTSQESKITFIVQHVAIDGNLADAVVVKRNEHIFFQGVVQADFISNIMMEQSINIEIIGPFRRCRHT